MDLSENLIWLAGDSEKIKKDTDKEKQAEKEKQTEKEKQKKLADVELVQQVKGSLKLNNLNNITSNVNLPSENNGVKITWASNNKNIISDAGKVTRPEAKDGDAIVTLTATFTKGEAKDTENFIVTVKAKEITDEEFVDEALKSIQLKQNLDCIVDNIKLPSSDEKNTVNITWNSNNPSVISNNGEVTRTDKDERVVIEATVKRGSISKTKRFNITVKAKEKNVEAEINLVASSLKIDNANNIDKDIKLPTALNGAVVTWKSNNESIVSNDGKIVRPKIGQPDANVTLVATITKEGKSTSKSFDLTIKVQQQLVANNEQEFHDILKSALENFETNVEIKVPNYNDTDYSLKILNKIVLENPQIDYGFYQVGGNISGFSGSQEKTVTANIIYRLSKEKMIEEKEAVKNKVQEILKSQIKDGMTDVQKELALHDYIVKNARYDVEHVNDNPVLPEDHNAYGVLVKNVGVCESYAKAMYELLNAAGVECKYVTGHSKHNGVKGTGHAWNMVKLDGEWYNLDATWDDPISDKNGLENIKEEDNWTPVLHTYFNVPDSIFNRDHIREESKVMYPKCTATKYSYDNMDVDEYTSDGTLIKKVISKDELDGEILKALEGKKKSLILRLKGFKMTNTELSNEIGKVLNSEDAKKKGLSFPGGSVSTPDEYHVKYDINWN